MSIEQTNSEQVRSLHRLASIMDEAFNIPGTRIKVGLDSIIGLIPGIGDGVGLATSGYIVYRGYKLGVRKRTLARMTTNSLVDSLIGAIPLVGDVFDIFFKAHRRNADLLERELAHQEADKQGS